MKASNVLLLLSAISIFFTSGSGNAGVIGKTLLSIGLAAIGAYLVVLGY